MFWSRAFETTTTVPKTASSLTRLDDASNPVESNGISGIKIISAPPAMPPCNAIQPAWRPSLRLPLLACDWSRWCVIGPARHHHVNRRIESECGRRRFQIVVDGFRDTDTIDAGFLQLLRRHERAVTPYND